MIAILATLLAATLVVAPVPESTNSPAGAGPARGPAEVAAGGAAVAGTNAAGLFVLPGAGAAAEDPGEAEYRRLLEMDDAAHEEIDGWIREADAAGPGVDNEALGRRIDQRVEGVEKAYREFLGKRPGHVNARVALGSFLHDLGREPEARAAWEKALELDPKNAAVYNNLAGIYGHRGPITNAFVYYEKAIALDPTQAVYHQNFATTVALFRKDVMEHYALADEQKVFDLALAHYRKALELEPRSFLIATDLAQTYYLIKPPRYEDALAAWRKALELASDDLEREGIRVHLARVQVQAGRFGEARTNLALITNTNYFVLRDRIRRTLESKEAGRDGEGAGKPVGF